MAYNAPSTRSTGDLITVLSSATTHTAEELRALVKTQLLDQ